jgi:hypothetical protein
MSSWILISLKWCSIITPYSAGKPLRIPLSWRLFVANMLILRLALQDGFLFGASAGESICFGAAITVDEE